MSAVLEGNFDARAALRPIGRYFLQPLSLFREYDRADLRPDLIAGLTVAVIMLPQAIAFALIAELPPVTGLYAAVVGSIVGALWGSSNQVHNGPTNANSLLILSALTSAAFVPGTDAFVIAAGMMAVMAGLLQLILGIARLGVLVNFVSYSVIVGFSAGAGLLIAVGQLKPLLGISFDADGLLQTIGGLATHLSVIHGPSAALGLGTIVLLIVLPRLNRRLPAALITMGLATVVVFAFNLRTSGVDVIGSLPTGLPPITELPIFDLDLLARLSAGALAIGAIGLVQTIAMARSIAAQTGQRLDSNQEFIGQGIANIAVGFFSGFPGAGSFSRSAVNYQAGAQTRLAALFSGVFVLVAMLILAPAAAYLPRSALAGVLVVIGVGLVDRAEIRRIGQGTRGDAVIMVITFAGTLFLEISFAVLLGILLSFVHYALRTSMPRVNQVLPDRTFRHFFHQPEKENCPQLSIVEIHGDLYFGAVNHVEEKLLRTLTEHPEQRFLLIRMGHVNHCDYSGIHMLENVVHAYRDVGGDVFIVRAGERVRSIMASTGFDNFLGEDRFLAEDDAVSDIFYHVLDPAICIYECPVRAFRECQNLPKRMDLVQIPSFKEIPEGSVLELTPQELWDKLHDRLRGEEQVPLVVDVREPREFRRGHVPEAQLVPLPTILSNEVRFPNDRQIVLICRTGRRSHRAAYALQKIGCMNVAVVRGGMVAWGAANLLEAVDHLGP